MIFSMTGYAKVPCELSDKILEIEIKSLNSRQLDISLRQPAFLRTKEMEMRQLIGKYLIRGKIDVFITFEPKENFQPSINSFILNAYFRQLKQAAKEEGIQLGEETYAQLLKMPEVLQTRTEDLSDEDWKLFLQAFEKAMEEVTVYRKKEGDTIKANIQELLHHVETLLEEIPRFEEERKELLTTRLQESLQRYLTETTIDRNRFEQEVIYYLDKLDINEEKQRLAHHCRYFAETLEKEPYPGKKLNFIAQEMVREINTLGAKANFASIQEIVVQMKDDTEKIKEQLMNVL